MYIHKRYIWYVCNVFVRPLALWGGEGENSIHIYLIPFPPFFFHLDISSRLRQKKTKPPSTPPNFLSKRRKVGGFPHQHRVGSEWPHPPPTPPLLPPLPSPLRYQSWKWNHNIRRRFFTSSAKKKKEPWHLFFFISLLLLFFVSFSDHLLFTS